MSIATHPQVLAVTIADDLRQSNAVADLGSKIARAAFEADYHSGPAPSSLAAAAVYLAGRLIHGEALADDAEAPTQSEVAAAADVSAKTIHVYYPKLASVADDAGVAEPYDDQLSEILETDE